ncbi:MAG: T9SS type A sorting domain-containing protein [Flavobacterium sp.]
MKKILFLSLILPLVIQAQFTELAPWRVSTLNKKNVTIDEMESEFEKYWELNDKNKKGSGYKPFKRWLEHWKQYTNKDGVIISPVEFWEAWKIKNNQKLNKSTSSIPVSNWTPMGPFSHVNTGSWSSGQGRVNIVEVDPVNPSIIYMGTPAGGIWKSINGGGNWSPLTDNLPQIGVSGIAIDPSNNNIIYIATGDKDAGDSYSVGIYKSINGGETWSATGLTYTTTNKRIGDIKIHPTNTQILWAATSDGVMKTINGGANWTNVVSGNFSQGSIRLKPGNSNIIYAVSKNAFFRSTNAGDTFTQVSTGLPLTGGRFVMDVTPANPEAIYILAAKTNFSFQGLYKSIDGGTSFTAMNTTTDVFESSQVWFDLALGVSTTNENLLFTGVLNVWTSSNGGVSFTKLNSWSEPVSPTYTHADIHYLGYHGNKLICGSDGGVYISDNDGVSFIDKTSNAQIGQFYKIAVAKQTTTKMMGGLQDNGGYALNNGIWQNYYGADGMDTAIHPTINTIYYGFIQNGSGLYISDNSGASFSSFVDIPANENGNWVTPLKMNNSGTLFAGYKKLYRLNGSVWTAQSTNNFGVNLDCIAIDNTNNNIIYVSENNNLYKSTDNGINFNNIFTFDTDITSIEVNNNNSNKIYITTQGSVTGKVFQTLDGGTSFTDITAGIPNIGKNVVKHQENHPDDAIYVGTSLGVYYRDNTLTSFVPFETNLPNTSVRDLEINIVDNKIVASTYGRGVWICNLPQPLSIENLNTYNIGIYPNPSNGIFTLYSHFYTPEKISITDISGKTIQVISQLNEKYNTINLEGFLSGIYFAKITINGNEVVKKLIKH